MAKTHSVVYEYTKEVNIMNKRRFFMCSSKIMYEDEDEALKMVYKIRGGEGKYVRQYKCEYCTGWHITSQKQEEVEHETA